MSNDRSLEACRRIVKLLFLDAPPDDLLKRMVEMAEIKVKTDLRAEKLVGAEWELVAVKRAFVIILASSWKTQILRVLGETDVQTKRRIEGHVAEMFGPSRADAGFNILDPECWDFRRVLAGASDLARTQDLVLAYVVVSMKEQQEALRAIGASLREAVESLRASQN